MPDRSDSQLIVDYLKGDEESLEILVSRYLKPVYNFICRYLSDRQGAEDVTQEVFIKTWRNLKKFDRQRSFKAWIFGIAKNACVDILRKKKAIPFSEFENDKGKNPLIETLADPSPLPDEIFRRADIAKMVNRAISQLTPKYRMVLFLRYNDHFTFKEIADALAEPIDTIKSRHRRGLAKLKKLLSET